MPEALQARLWRHELAPLAAALAALVASALLIDAALHLLGIVWIGRWLGIPGVLLILGSFGYSMRKRKLIRHGHPATLLRWHERLAWLGSLLVLVHAGIHFNALLAWLAVGAMLINIGSGLVGKYLIARSRRRLDEARERLRGLGLPPEELAARTHWDSLTFDAVQRWRTVHFPISLAFGVLALAHVVATLLFWNWR